MKKIFLIFIVLSISLTCRAEDLFEQTLTIIAANNPELRRAVLELQAHQAENSTELAPADPQVEVGYLWNSERGGGNRKDLSVTQELEFPTVYARRRALSRAANTLAEAEYRHSTVELYRSARQLLIDLTYYNALHAILEQRLEYATTIKDGSRQALEQGEITIIDFNKAAMDHALCQGELRRTELELTRLNAELTLMNGNTPLSFNNKEFPPVTLNADTEDIIRTASAPELDILAAGVNVAGQEERLARSSWIPKFSLGYSSEFQAGNSLQGAVLGVSIPLWENKNKVRAARLRVLSSSMELYNSSQALNTEYTSILSQISELQSIETSYAEALNSYDSDALTLQAFQAGQITILEYANQMQYTLELRRNLLDTRRQIAALYTRLYTPAL